MGRKSRSMQMQRPTKQTFRNRIWVPTIPSWEKEFCYKIGQFKWEDFLEAKKLKEFSHRVLEWNDSAGEEAFRIAKNRFHAMINSLPSPNEPCDPDLYIDDIHWEDNVRAMDFELLDELGPAVDEKYEDEGEDEDKNEDNKEEHVPDYYHIRIEDIKATGWDVDIEETNQRARILTGLVVGY